MQLRIYQKSESTYLKYLTVSFLNQRSKVDLYHRNIYRDVTVEIRKLKGAEGPTV